MTLPEKALSIRQPWAWAVIHAGKDIENRSWQAVNHGLNQCGRIAIHAAVGMTQREYKDAADFMSNIGVTCPEASELQRGGIIGLVDVVDVVREHSSPWFFGPRGLVLENPVPCDFIPVKGNLGFFNWRAHRTDVVARPARWMTADRQPKEAQNTLPLFDAEPQKGG